MQNLTIFVTSNREGRLFWSDWWKGAEKTNPGASELKKSPSSFEQEGLYKALKATRYTKQGLPLRRNYVCPAFNPPDIQYLLCLAPLNFYPVKPYRLTGTKGQRSVFNRGVLCVFVVYPVQSRRAI